MSSDHDRALPAEGFRQVRYQRPPGATDVLLVRHGESAAAHLDRPFPKVGLHGDPALHALGHEQAEQVAERLMHEPLAAIYVTNLRRTAETAAPLARRLGMTPLVEADLREVHLGDFDPAMFRKMVSEGHPLAIRMAEEERWDVIPGAEPAGEFAARIRRGLTRVAAAHPDETVAVFTHGGVIGQAFAQATGSRPFAFNGADNASISHLVIVSERWAVRRFNDTAHLSPGFTSASR